MIKRKSYFKDPVKDHNWFFDWVRRLEKLNDRIYSKKEIQTQLGKTLVWTLNEEKKDLPALVIFPGFRTSPLFWDLDKGLDELLDVCRIYLVETNGQPNPSDGHSPSIKSLAYGEWASEVLKQLEIEKCYIAGSSFGGTVCMKLCIVAPEKIIAAFLLNPGCLQPFSMSFKNLYHNLLPILSPKRKNVIKFLDTAVFSKPNHELKGERHELIVEYEVFALTRYKDKTEKPYFMKKELPLVKTDTYLLLGDKDLLFPYKKSFENAGKLLLSLKETMVVKDFGHGIETDRRAMQFIRTRIKN